MIWNGTMAPLTFTPWTLIKSAEYCISLWEFLDQTGSMVQHILVRNTWMVFYVTCGKKLILSGTMRMLPAKHLFTGLSSQVVGLFQSLKFCIQEDY